MSVIKPTTLVFIVLTPLLDTPMENVRVSLMDVAKVITIAKLMFPNVPLTLGCIRAKGTERGLIEKMAIQAGITNVAVPSGTQLKKQNHLE